MLVIEYVIDDIDPNIRKNTADKDVALTSSLIFVQNNHIHIYSLFVFVNSASTITDFLSLVKVFF